MFKKKFMPRFPRGRFFRRRGGTVDLPGIFSLFIIYLAGCQLFPMLAPVNLSEPGWVTRQGQAVWRASRTAPEIAGEMLVATNSDGRAFVQFTKTPLPFLTAQSTTNSWQLHSIPDDKTYSGRGRPPVRAIWLWLPGCLAGRPPPKPLAWQRETDNNWRLENLATGESLEGYLAP
jgi:hypothetical protein